MSSRLGVIGLISLIGLSLLGCQNYAVTTPENDRTVVVNGPLTLTITDFPADPGVLWIAPTAEGGKGVLTATSIRYGSLCALAVSGSANVAGNRVDLHVAFTPRLTQCVAEVRALRYDAVIGALPPGRYDVHILHSDGAGETEVRVQSLVVT